VVTARISGGQGVEDGGEGGNGERRAELRRGGDGLSEVGADARKEHINIGRLVNEVDQKVVGRSDLCIFQTRLVFSEHDQIEMQPNSDYLQIVGSWSTVSPLTLLGGTAQSGRRGHELLQNLIALLEVGLAFRLFLLAERFEERGDLGLEATLFAEGIDVLGKLVGEFGKGTLNEESSGRGGHDVGCGRRRGRENVKFLMVESIDKLRNFSVCQKSLGARNTTVNISTEVGFYSYFSTSQISLFALQIPLR
jgi:hypothetical protein